MALSPTTAQALERKKVITNGATSDISNELMSSYPACATKDGSPEPRMSKETNADRGVSENPRLNAWKRNENQKRGVGRCCFLIFCPARSPRALREVITNCQPSAMNTPATAFSRSGCILP